VIIEDVLDMIDNVYHPFIFIVWTIEILPIFCTGSIHYVMTPGVPYK